MARFCADPTLPDRAHVDHLKPSGPLFVITIRCRDGSVERVPVHEGPHGLLPAPTKVGRQIAAVLTHYRPA